MMTATGFWDFVCRHLMNTGALAVFVFLLWWLEARSPVTRFVGRITFALCVSGYFFAGLVRYLLDPNDPSWGGYAFLGMICASLFGVLLGLFLWRFYGPDDTPEEEEADSAEEEEPITPPPP